MTTLFSNQNGQIDARPAYALVRLYAHVDIKDGARRGTLVTQGNFPEQTVASKARYGIYPWQIGPECMSRVFKTVKVVDGKTTHGEPTNGCPSCRANPTESEKKDKSVEDALRERIFELEKELESKTKHRIYECSTCEFWAETEIGLKVHTGRQHKKDNK